LLVISKARALLEAATVPNFPKPPKLGDFKELPSETTVIAPGWIDLDIAKVPASASFLGFDAGA
jgi:hypothetical protein